MTISEKQILTWMEKLSDQVADQEREQARRQKEGLPSWDVYFTRKQWESIKEEALKQGLIKKQENCFVVHSYVAPPARALIYGDPPVNPIEEDHAKH